MDGDGGGDETHSSPNGAHPSVEEVSVETYAMSYVRKKYKPFIQFLRNEEGVTEKGKL